MNRRSRRLLATTNTDENAIAAPATIGVIILACLIGFAVRHRVITRMKARDLPEDTAPRHAAPEAEQIEDDSEARTTVLTR